DKEGNPLYPHILWADQRSWRESNWIKEQISEQRLFELTGLKATETKPLSKILWLQRNEPDVFANTHRFLNCKDYLVFRMTNRICTDPSDASSTLLFHILDEAWSVDLCHTFGVPIEKMPDVVQSSAIAGYVTPQAADSTGLLPGTPVVMGGGDGCAANLGAGCVEDGDVHLSLGTSAWIMQSSDAPLNRVEDGLYNYCHVVPGMYSPTGAMQAAGSSYRWFSDIIELGREDRLSFEKDMRAIKPGANGLLYLPHLMGERSPYWNPKARGAFLGLKRETSREEMMRAILEGVAMHLAVIRERFDPTADQINSVNAIGGGARSDLWCQILSDVMRVRVNRLSRLEEAGGLGVAVLAGVGTKLFSDFNVIHKFQTVERVFEPESNSASFYESRLALFKEAYEVTRHIQAKLADGM
ncbi:MAG TPA: xylulokinase, partial [Fastidiosipila sp.]|nr:xylulokinase [Fastidiosipila sp.]